MEFRGAPVFRPRELAHDLGRAAAWCGFVHTEEAHLRLVGSAVLIEEARIVMRVGVAETDEYYQKMPFVWTAEAALAAFGYDTGPRQWSNLSQRIFVFADDLSAHEMHHTITFLIRSGLKKTLDT
jgi:hypothetical protein